MNADFIKDALADLTDEHREIVESFMESLNQHILENANLTHSDLQTDFETDLTTSDFPEKGDKVGEHYVVLDSETVMCMGAPCPVILADEHKLSVSFYLTSEVNREKSAVFIIRGVSSFEQAGNLGGSVHDCVFAPFGYDNVWERKLADDDVELVFGFHDTSLRVICKEFSYSVHRSEEALPIMDEFILGAVGSAV